jgi:dTDP-4-amino-4,6-dideoxygalactose transaminase
MNRFIVPYFSFDYQDDLYRDLIIKEITKVIDSKSYVLGNQLSSFEKSYSKLTNSIYTVGVGSGLDALIISLKALKIKPGDEIIVPSNTYIATWLSISALGATIVPVEPDIRTSNIDAKLIEEKITVNTKAIMPVHLYGNPCDMDLIMDIASKHKLFVVEDNAQAQLAIYNGKYTGTFGDINATSFYPTKNLGAIGEAGAITTNNEGLSDFVKTYRNYGSKEKYINIHKGVNSRLDEIQAAILNIKLPYLKKLTSNRIEIAKCLKEGLKGVGDLLLPYKHSKSTHVYHIFNIRTEKRDKLASYLNSKGIGTSIHYPIPPHLQEAYKNLKYKEGDFPISEKLAKTSLSLPLFPGMTTDQVEFVVKSIKSFFNE